jgi:hypothetical protein
MYQSWTIYGDSLYTHEVSNCATGEVLFTKTVTVPSAYPACAIGANLSITGANSDLSEISHTAMFLPNYTCDVSDYEFTISQRGANSPEMEVSVD